MQVQYKLPRVMEGEFERVGELRAGEYSIDEVEAVIVNRRVLEASAPRQFWVPHMQPLVALELHLHKAEAVRGILLVITSSSMMMMSTPPQQ